MAQLSAGGVTKSNTDDDVTEHQDISSAASAQLWQTSKAEVMLMCQTLSIKDLLLLFRFKILH